VTDLPIPGEFSKWLAELGAGEREFPNCDGERHHYVPQFLLQRFRGKGHLFQLDKLDGTCKETTAKEAAWDKDLYMVESTTGEHDGIVEALFGLSENFAAPSLKGLLRGPENLTDGNRGNLAFLIAIQEQRAPGFMQEHKESVTHAGITRLAVELANMQGPKGKRRKAQEAYEALTAGRVKITPAKEMLLSLSLAMLAYAAKLIYELPWTLLTTTEGNFVCSDRPLTMHDPTPPFPGAAPAWVSSEMVEATMPMSTKACLRISPRGHARLNVQPTTKQVDRINLRTYGWATRYIYGPSVEALELLHEIAVADPSSAPQPIKKALVMLEDQSTADPEIARRNVARGRPRYIRDLSGESDRLMSYEVVESEDDARRSVAPRRRGEDEVWISELR
jgi:hypothetical protein